MTLRSFCKVWEIFLFLTRSVDALVALVVCVLGSVGSWATDNLRLEYLSLCFIDLDDLFQESVPWMSSNMFLLHWFSCWYSTKCIKCRYMLFGVFCCSVFCLADYLLLFALWLYFVSACIHALLWRLPPTVILCSFPSWLCWFVAHFPHSPALFSHIHHIHFFLVTFYVYARVCRGLCSEVISRMKTSFGRCSDHLFCAFLIMLSLLHNKNRSILAAECFLVINTLNAVYVSQMFIFVFSLDALSIFS